MKKAFNFLLVTTKAGFFLLAALLLSAVMYFVNNHYQITWEEIFVEADGMVFERGDTRYYDFLKERISVVVDLYDSENYKNYGNYYSPKKPLTAANILK